MSTDELVAFLMPRAQTALEAHHLSRLKRRLQDHPASSLEGLRARLDAMSLTSHPHVRRHLFSGEPQELASFLADQIAQLTRDAERLDAGSALKLLAEIAAWR